ncbi:MAG: tRNA pseudouridine(55) synthase, partial [Bacteroidota bacterium]
MTIFIGAENDYQAGAIILINKDIGQTSFGAVKNVRYLLKKKFSYDKLKVGHAGTLDPLAEGLLIICTGKETKNTNAIQQGQKEYLATILLGATTPSYDRETEPDTFFPVDHINEEMILKTIKDFTGNIQQVPPLYSAVHINGERAYKKIRRGDSFQINSRSVSIEEICLIENNFPE